MRTKRIYESNAVLDEEERIWWNENAETIEEIWAQNIHFQKIIRLPYLLKMKFFFNQGDITRPVKILEIGCGTGWVCRLVADEKFHVIGTDFSEGQLAIAHKMAKEFHKEKYCTYELADASTIQKDIDGVVIHALLHHLSTREIGIFFENFAHLKKGTKVFLYEPVFFDKRNEKPSFRDKVINKLIHMLKNYALNKARKIGKENKELTLAMNKINTDAELNGWYISPKEIPFAEGELEELLEKNFVINRKYIVNKTELEIAQALTMNCINKPGLLYSKILIPLSRKLDNLLFKGTFTQYLFPNQHLFVCFEIIKK